MSESISAIAIEYYNGLLDYLTMVKEQVASGAEAIFDLKVPDRIIKAIVASPEMLTEMSSLIWKEVQGIDVIIQHQVNTMILSLQIGVGLTYDQDTLLELGLSSLLHDVGFFKFPEEFLRRPGPLEADVEMMRAHPELGRDILSRFKQQHPLLPEVVYQHRERLNGIGYPRGLSGDGISPLAGIVGLAGTFEAMTHDRPHRKRLKHSFALKEIIAKPDSLLFAPKILKAFLQEITPYPVGCLVMLNNKLLCEVVAINRTNPLRPTIRVLYDQSGSKVAGDWTIHLKDSPIHYIVESLSPDEL